MDIIQEGLRYNLSKIEEAVRKSDLEAMLLRGNHKSEKSDLNVAALETVTDKEMKQGWVLTLTIYSIDHIKDVGVIPLGVAEIPR